MSFVGLHIHSDYSLLDGASQIPALIDRANELGMKAIAEGVETPQQLNQLKALNCDEAQGYLFSKPLEPESAEAFIAANQHWKPTLSHVCCIGNIA